MTQDRDALENEERRLLEYLRELSVTKPETWACVENCGFSAKAAISLQDKGLVDTWMQMGMTTARLHRSDLLAAQIETLRLYAKQLRELGYETLDGRRLLANRLEGVASNLDSLGLVMVRELKPGVTGKGEG